MPDPAPLRAPDELQPPPRDIANTVGGGIDGADLGETAPNPPDRSSDHDAEGWRETPPQKP